MKYNVVQNVSSNMVIKSTWEDKAKAKQAYHDTLKNLYSDKDTTSGVVAILDDNLDVVDGMKELINKEG